jgi:predicted transposase YdaD
MILASLAFENESEAEREWLERTFAMLNDTLRNTRAYQKILNEGREEGLEKGLEQGRQEALQQELQRQRQAVLDIVLERFPKLTRLVRKHVDAIEDPAILLHLIVKMSTVQTAEEAKELLLTVAGDEE